MPARQRRPAKAVPAPESGSERRPCCGSLPPEPEAKLIAPEICGLPDLSGLVDGATAGPLPQRHLEPVCYDTTEAGRGEPAVKLQYDQAAVPGDARGAVGKATALRPRRAERASAAGVLMPTLHKLGNLF